MRIAEIYTDGSSTGKEGPGGWGYLVKSDGFWTFQNHGWTGKTTNNRMEMIAAIMALKDLYDRDGSQYVRIWSDSAYLINGMNERWYEKWARRNFLAGPPGGRYRAKNLDLWELLIEHEAKHRKVAWAHVKGHSGHPENEEVDRLARDARILGETRRREGWE